MAKTLSSKIRKEISYDVQNLKWDETAIFEIMSVFRDNVNSHHLRNTAGKRTDSSTTSH